MATLFDRLPEFRVLGDKFADVRGYPDHEPQSQDLDRSVPTTGEASQGCTQFGTTNSSQFC